MPAVDPAYIRSWAASPEAQAYLDEHIDRLLRTLDLLPQGSAQQRILEMGAYLQVTPALQHRLGYGEVRGCYFGPRGEVDHRSAVSSAGEEFRCDIELFDADKDPFPYGDEYFNTVLCCELIEHLRTDPMHLMAEANRILAPGGHFLLTTPNAASLRALSAILQGYHPGFFPAYLKPHKSAEGDERHNREYTPKELQLLMRDAGFEVVRLETGPFKQEPHPELQWVEHLLDRYLLSKELRGDGIYVLGRKTGPVRARYPEWLYA
jgi:SAM-dependent methyltransferase